MTCSRIIFQTRSVTGGDFSCKRQIETPLRCKLQEKIASCDSAFKHGNTRAAGSCSPFNFSFSQTSTRVSITVCSSLLFALLFLKYFLPLVYFSNGKFSSIACSYKAGSGFLYPLERGFMFVTKPPVHIRFDEISYVNFARVQTGGGTSRSFDFEVEHKNSSVITFSSIDK